MSQGLYSGVSGLAIGTGLYKGVPGLWSGASGLITPNTNPSLSLNFLTGTLDPRITFTRTNPVATFVGSNGFIQTAASNVPRFDYDPVTLQPKGLLIEEQRTNSLLYSEQFDNASWLKVGTTATANDVSVVAPDGTTNADKLAETAVTAEHYIEQGSISVVAGSSYTFSIYVKAAGRSQVVLRYTLAASWVGGISPQVLYDFSTVTTTIISGGSAITARSLTAVGGGWYRCSITATCAANSSPSARLHLYNGGISYAGNTALGVYLYGSQFETGAFGTSYIPTTTPAVIRSADIATMTGTNFSSWFNASAGTFVANFEASPNQYATYIAASNGVVGQNSVHFDNDATGVMRAVYYSGSAAVATLSLGSYGTAGTVNTVGSAYAVDDFAASRNGGAVVTDTSGALPVGQNQLNIGADPSAAAVNVTNTHIRYLNYYNTRLPDGTLQSLTA